MPRPRALSPDTARALAEEAAHLRATGTTSLRGWAQGMAEIHQVSIDTVYRAAKAPVASRKRRADAGTLRAMDADALCDVAAFTVRYGYPAELALDTINLQRREQGLPEYAVHVETVRRHLRQLGISRRDNAEDRRVVRRWEAPYPLYLVQIDSTCAHSYYIDTDDTIGYEAPVARNKNKAGNGKPRLWLLSVIDDYSRVRWARYYTGNNAGVWRDMLIRVMRCASFGEPSEWPAFGVPERVYTDQDAAMKAQENVDFLAAFGIERLLARPSTQYETNAQAKGKVERTGGYILHSFEVVTRGRRFTSLREMNDVLGRFLLTVNNKVHGSTGCVPFERWLEAESIRVLPEPEIVRRLSARSADCRVSADLSIRLEKRTFQLPRREPFLGLVKRTVPVRYFAADLARITVLVDGHAHDIEAVDAVPDTAGEHHSTAQPVHVELRRALQQHDLAEYDGVVHKVFTYRAQKDKREYPIRPTQVEHPLTTAHLAPAMIRRGQAITRMQAAGIVAAPPTPEQRAAIDALLAGRPELPEAELDLWIKARREGGAATSHPRLRVERG